MLDKKWFIEILKAGIPVSIIYKNDGIWYDLNTGAKSHLHIYPVDGGDRGEYIIDTRYDEPHAVHIHQIQDVVWLVRHCMYGRDYANEGWIKLMLEHGVAEEVITKNIKFK